GASLTKLRALAKEARTDHAFARELWATGATAARLVALLVCRPKEFSREELDTMIREARAPKVLDWLVSYVVKKSPHAEELRLAWIDDDAPEIGRASCRERVENAVVAV